MTHLGGGRIWCPELVSLTRLPAVAARDRCVKRIVRNPLALSIVVLALGLLGGWLLSDHKFGPPDLQEFRSFVGSAASVATLLAVVATGYFVLSSDKAIDELRGRVEDVHSALTPEQASESAPGDEEVTPDGGVRTFEVAVDGQQVQFARLMLAQVPLRVWAALVGTWEEAGQDGTWTGENVVWVVRRTGRGNFPWIIAFSDEPDHVHSVVYGGQGKRGPTVKRYEKPGFLRSLDE